MRHGKTCDYNRSVETLTRSVALTSGRTLAAGVNDTIIGKRVERFGMNYLGCYLVEVRLLCK